MLKIKLIAKSDQMNEIFMSSGRLDQFYRFLHIGIVMS